MPVFVYAGQMFGMPSWEQKVAGIISVGGITKGPSSQAFFDQFKHGFTTLIGCLKDPIFKVRETMAWTFSKVAEFHGPELAKDPNFTALLDSVCYILANDDPKVAQQACGIIENLCNSLINLGD